MDELKKEIGKRIAEIRKAKKLNQEELKELIGAPTVQMISGWENGHSFPSVPYLVIFAKKLDTSLDYLLLGNKKDAQDKSIITYKDAAEYILQFVFSGLFDISGYQYGPNEKQYAVTLTSKDAKIRDFKLELDNLMVAANSLRPELLRQALSDLLKKYDYAIKKTNEK